MILDGGTNQVLNANIAPINGTTDGVNEIADESSLCKAGIAVMDGNLIVNTSSEVYVKAYDLAGNLRVSASCEGFTELSLNGYKGILLVNISDKEGNNKSAKFLVL